MSELSYEEIEDRISREMSTRESEEYIPKGSVSDKYRDEPLLDKDSGFSLFLLVVGFSAFIWTLISIALDNHNCGL